MKYLVVLNSDSPVGAMFLRGNNDGHVNDGDSKHPCLDCDEVVADAPYYLFVRRDREKQGKGHQSMQIPHSSVLYIHHYHEEAETPFGFSRST